MTPLQALQKREAEWTFEYGLECLKKMGLAHEMYAGEFHDYAPVDLFYDVGLCSSRNEAKRLLKQGGLRIEHPSSRFVWLWRGKKKAHIVELDWTDHVMVVVE